jgi:hypothetical protein
VEEKDVRAREAFFKKLNTDKTFPAMVRKGLEGLMLDDFEKGRGVKPGFRYGEEFYLPCEDVVREFERGVLIK